MLTSGEKIYKLAEQLFPICRSITGDGVRETLRQIKERLPSLRIHEVPTGTRCFDWTVPHEWNIRDAWVVDPDGRKIIDFQISNLHVVGYSTPVNAEMDLEELEQHLYSLPDQPNAIPYVTSYYKERWGFCLTHEQRQSLKPGAYQVMIDSELKNGSLTYGEYILPGQTDREVFLSTYVCHPSMGNN
jgi:aminopeptidase-like protein